MECIWRDDVMTWEHLPHYLPLDGCVRRFVMMTSSNGKLFRVTGALYGEFTGHRWIPRTKVSEAELWNFLWSALYSKRLSKQSWGWWPETPSRSLWRHCSVGEMHRSPVFPSQTNSNIELWCCDFFVVGPNELMRKRSSCLWFDTPWNPYDVTIMRICFVNSPQAIVYGNDIVITADLFNCNSKFVKSPYDIWGCNFCNINHRHLNAQSVLPSTERLGVIS